MLEIIDLNRVVCVNEMGVCSLFHWKEEYISVVCYKTKGKKQVNELQVTTICWTYAKGIYSLSKQQENKKILIIVIKKSWFDYDY